MKNLDTAIENTNSESSDEIINGFLKDSNLEDSLRCLTFDVAKAIGGYSNGSDIYDDCDEKLAMELLGVTDDDEFSLDYDHISDIKDAYASDVTSKLKDFDMTSLPSFKFILKECDLSEDELNKVLQTSSIFKDLVYENMTQPRG